MAVATPNSNVMQALSSFYKISAACKAAVSLVEARQQEQAAAAREAADAVLYDEKMIRKECRQELDTAWEVYNAARQEHILAFLRKDPAEELLKKACKEAFDNLAECIKYAEALGIDEYYDEDDEEEDYEEEDYSDF
jgi:hypothetical protein